MEINQRKEQFSRAFVHAVASVAGFCLYEPKVDDDSVDVGFMGRGGGRIRAPRLEAQLKCTSESSRTDDALTFALNNLKNYDDLRAENLLVPRVLIVMRVPELQAEWTSQSEDQLVMRHCAYWCSFFGQPAVSNLWSLRIHIPRSQRFTPQALTDIMRLVSEGGHP